MHDTSMLHTKIIYAQHVRFCMYNILHTHLLELVGSKVKGEHPDRSSQWVCYHQQWREGGGGWLRRVWDHWKAHLLSLWVQSP